MNSEEVTEVGETPKLPTTREKALSSKPKSKKTLKKSVKKTTKKSVKKTTKKKEDKNSIKTKKLKKGSKKMTPEITNPEELNQVGTNSEEYTQESPVLPKGSEKELLVEVGDVVDVNYNSEEVSSSEKASDSFEENLEEPQEEVPVPVSATLLFKTQLQTNFEAILSNKLKDQRLSTDIAYKLFKESFDSVVEFLLNAKDSKLPLNGIGTFKITMDKPRVPVRGGVSKLADFEAIPHLKWKPSDRYRKYLLREILGYVAE